MMSFSKLHTQASYVYINGKDSQGLLQFNEDVTTLLWYFLTRISRLKDAVVEIPDCCIHGAGNLGILTSCNIIFANFNHFTCTHYRSPSSTGVCKTNQCLVNSSLRHCQLY
jgi:hypothetical protein